MTGSLELNSTPPDPKVSRLQELCKLLLDEERLRLLGLLASTPHGTDALAAASGLKARTVVRHLQALQAGGLIAVVRTGEDVTFALDVRAIQELKRALFARPEPVYENEAERTLGTFVKGGRLVGLPVAPARLQTILVWLVESFEKGRDYAEHEVNERLSGHAVDYATLRRLLIDHGYLTRTSGVYRRHGGEGVTAKGETAPISSLGRAGKPDDA